ncbi:MAG: L-seryl-tRNA(Sec) selenium transferase [Fimbriimonadales bacterium]
MSELSRLPGIDKLLSEPQLASFPHRTALLAARQAVNEARNGMPIESILARAVQLADGFELSPHRPAINCSGTIMNTGLGRSRLSKEAVEAIHRVASSHSTLEIDLKTGRRGDRQAPLESLLRELTGAASAIVVNNNAGAVLLAVHTFAAGGSVLLSRGQSVEIGGAFRMPDVVAAAGARLLDVGCTNKTRLSDYADAIQADTRVILRCHPSNFKITGFVDEPTAEELAALANEKGLVLIDDVGSGCLFNSEDIGLPHEPTLTESLQGGAHVVTASGDKLLGATQAGILLGSADHIGKLKKSPMARALRIDKLTAAGLEATLRLAADNKWEEIPTYRALSRTVDEMKTTAERIIRAVGQGEVGPGTCEPGGGSLPGVTLPSIRIGFIGMEPEALAASLRNGDVPLIGYIEKGTFWLDLRAVEEQDIDPLIHELKRALA